MLSSAGAPQALDVASWPQVNGRFRAFPIRRFASAIAESGVAVASAEFSPSWKLCLLLSLKRDRCASPRCFLTAVFVQTNNSVFIRSVQWSDDKVLFATGTTLLAVPPLCVLGGPLNF